ncbi:hypothetical protein HID58_094282 [Brassica napus]|uniref:Uncharacterized protein n=1 Tax=Brassica napus TaxID=3708 RepID=A0ABQ7X7R9_BRANA|nr:hypothetical protein HID58_094282 [Brassica napus]
MVENPWLSPSGLASVLNPSSSTPGEPPPLKPLDPPDPHPLAFGDFPPLSSSPAKSSSPITIHSTVHPQTFFRSTILPAKDQTSTTTNLPFGSDVTMEDSVDFTKTISRSETMAVLKTVGPLLTVLPPKHSSPLLTNHASAPPRSFTSSSLPPPPLMPSLPPDNGGAPPPAPVPPAPVPSVNLRGYSSNVTMEPHTTEGDNPVEAVLISANPTAATSPQLDSDSQAAVDYITDTLLPFSDNVMPTVPGTIALNNPPALPFTFSALPPISLPSNSPLLPVHTLSSSTPPPSPPSSPLPQSLPTLSFTSDPVPASFVLCTRPYPTLL